jgi:peptidoglycan/xylan/chitin deacetylase (PgdA/CDA1 family)
MRAILTWHSLDRSGSPISVTPDEFRRQLAWLTGAGVRVVSLEELLAMADDAAAVALTFDDGFVNFATEAAPVLHQHGLPATLFIVTGHVGRDNRWRGVGDRGVPVLPLLGWEALGKLREAGVSLGAHTGTHRRLSRCGAPELQAELVLAADEMQRRLGERPQGFAYPYGDADSSVAEAVASAYGWACTTEFRPLSTLDSMNRLPRLDAWYFREPARLAGWGSVRFRSWLWTRRQARNVRAALSGTGRATWGATEQRCAEQTVPASPGLA